MFLLHRSDLHHRALCVMMTLCASVVSATVVRAQGASDLGASLVRIQALEQGTGVVVQVDSNGATVVTAAHVLLNAQSYEVVFGSDPQRNVFTVSVTDLSGAEFGDQNYGLAAFRVRGAVPSSVKPATFGSADRLGPKDALRYAGYPGYATVVQFLSSNFSSPVGKAFAIDRAVGGGGSGGAAFKDGRVVGIAVAATDAPRQTFAVKTEVVISTLLGWKVSLSPGTATLSGTVANQLGELVPNASVRLKANDPATILSTTTDKQGHFQLTVPVETQYQLVASRRATSLSWSDAQSVHVSKEPLVVHLTIGGGDDLFWESIKRVRFSGPLRFYLEQVEDGVYQGSHVAEAKSSLQSREMDAVRYPKGVKNEAFYVNAITTCVHEERVVRIPNSSLEPSRDGLLRVWAADPQGYQVQRKVSVAAEGGETMELKDAVPADAQCYRNADGQAVVVAAGVYTVTVDPDEFDGKKYKGTKFKVRVAPGQTTARVIRIEDASR